MKVEIKWHSWFFGGIAVVMVILSVGFCGYTRGYARGCDTGRDDGLELAQGIIMGDMEILSRRAKSEVEKRRVESINDYALGLCNRLLEVRWKTKKGD